MTVRPAAVHPARGRSINITPAERAGRVIVGLAGLIVGLSCSPARGRSSPSSWRRCSSPPDSTF